ncbi:MAG: YHYH protein [Planctomycetota bacterium]|nr:YHYH protein [Planctomycetota bacterium]
MAPLVSGYQYVAGSGDLGEHNGRQAVTPEFPKGTPDRFNRPH